MSPSGRLGSPFMRAIEDSGLPLRAISTSSSSEFTIPDIGGSAGRM